MAQGRIKLGVDIVKGNTSGLTQIQAELAKIQQISLPSLQLQGIDVTEKQLNAVKQEAQELSNLLMKNYNFKLNSVDLQGLSKELHASGKTLAELEVKFSKLGPEGQLAFAKINSEMKRTNQVLKEAHPMLEKMGKTFANTIRWSVATTAINSVTGSIQRAWSFTKSLDKSLTDIRVVTGKSADEMKEFARQANSAAKALGSSTKSYADAALIYYQQGLGEADVAARTKTTLKAANITGQDARAVSEQLTAVWNGYKVSAQESEIYIDKLSAVAARTAADLEELSTGMSRVASAANIMGVDIDQLNAQLATIVSVTREAPESVGTALKTVYARMSDIQSGLDAETTLGEYTTQLAQFGINALDAQGNLRDMGDVVEEIGGKWQFMTRTQQAALAQTIAGTRQYSRMMALFDNWDMYTSAKTTSRTAAGTLEKQNEIALDSLDKKLEQLTTTTEQLYLTLFDSKGFKVLIDGFTSIIELVSMFTESLGGAIPLLATMGAVTLKLTSSSISGFVGSAVQNRAINKSIKQQNAIRSQGQDEASLLDLKIERKMRWNELNSEQIQKTKEYNEIKAEMKKNAEKLQPTKAPDPTSDEYKAMIAEQEKLRQELNKITRRKGEILDEKEQIAAGEKMGKLNIAELQQAKAIAEKRAQQDEQRLRARRYLSDEEYKIWEERQLAEEEATIRIKALEAERKSVETKAEAEIKNIKEEAVKAREAQLEEWLDQEKKANEEIVRLYKEREKQLKAIDKASQKDRETEADIQAIVAKQTNIKKAIDFTDADSVEAARVSMVQHQSELEARAKLVKGLQSGAGTFDIGAEEKALSIMQEEQTALEKEGASQAVINELTTAIENLKITIDQAQKNPEAITSDTLQKANEAKQTFAVQASAQLKTNLTANKRAQAALDSTENEKRQARKAEYKQARERINDQNKITEKAANDAAENVKTLKSKTGRDKAKKDLEIEREAELKNLQKTEDDKIEILTKSQEDQQAIIDATMQMEENAQNQRAADDSFDKQKIKAKETTEAITKTVEATLSLVTAISTLANLPSIWNSEDLSAGEKAAQILMNIVPATIALGVALKTIVPGLQKIKNEGWKTVGAFFGIGVGAKAAEKGVEGADKATKTFGKTLLSSPLLPFIGILLAVVAALALIIHLIDQGVKAYNKDAIAAEKAAKHADELAEAYSRVKAEYESLKKSIEDYHSAQDAIDKLVIGTDEWRDAIAEANAQIMELVQTYPELAKYLSSEGGRLTISEEGLEAVEQVKRQETNSAYRESLQAQIDAAEKKTTENATSFKRKAGVSGAEFEDALKILAQPGNEEALLSSETLKETLQAFGDTGMKTELQDSGFAEQLIAHRDSLAELVAATRESIATNDALTKEIARSRLSENQTYQQWTDRLSELTAPDKQDYQSPAEYAKAVLEYEAQRKSIEQEMSNAEAYFGSKAYSEQKKQELKAQWYDDGDSIMDATWDERETMLKRYWSRKLGIPENDIQVAYVNGDSYTLKYLKDGEWTKQSGLNYEDMSDDFIEQELANATISQTEINEFQKKFDKAFGDSTSNLKTAFSTFIGDGLGDFSALTEEEFEAFSAGFKGLTFNDIRLDPTLYEDLKQKARALGLETTDEALKKLFQGIQSGIENYEQQEAKIQSLFLNTAGVAEGTGDITSVLGATAAHAFENLSQAIKLQLAQLWNDLALASSEGAEVATSILSELTAEDATLISTALSRTDWSDTESITEFNALMASSTNATTEELKDFVFQMRYAKGLIEDFNISKAADDFTNLQSILEAVVKEERNITTEQFETLTNEMQSYFLRMADGTYTLVGAAEEFAEKAKEARRNALVEQAGELLKKELTSFTDARTVTDAEKQKIAEDRAARKTQLEKAAEKTSKVATKKQIDSGAATERSNAATLLDFIESANLEQYDANWISAMRKAAADSAGGLSSNESRLVVEAYNVAKASVATEIANLSSDQGLKQAYQDYLAEKLAENNIQLDDSFALTKETKALFSQIFAEETSVNGLEKAFALLKEQEGYDSLAQEDRDWIAKQYEQYQEKLQTDLKNFTLDVDPYKEINQELDKAAKKLEKLNALASLLTGEDYLDNLKAQNDVLNEQIATQQKALGDSGVYTKEVQDKRQELETVFAEAGLQGFTFDENGNITNYNEVLTSAENTLRQSKDLGTANTFKENIVSALDAYDEALSKQIDAEADMLDKKTQILANNIEAFEFTLELKIDKHKLQRDYTDFLRSFTKDSEYTSLIQLNMQDIETVANTLQDYKTALDELESKQILSAAEINALAEVSDNIISQADYEAQKQGVINNLMSEGINLLDARNSLEETYLGYQEAVESAYEDYITLIETANDLLEYQVTVSELLYGNKAFKHMNDYYEKQVANNALLVTATRERYEQDRVAYNQFLKEGLTFDDEKVVAAREQYLASGKAYAETLATDATTYAEQYNNTLETILSNFSEKMLDDTAIKEWAWALSTDDLILDSIEEAYGKTELQRKLNAAMRDNSNLKAQQALKTVYDAQLKALEKKEKLSQRDLERAQQQLDIEIARLALEDARDSKTQMRLMRNSNGMYSYQYVADQNAIDAKQKEYEEALKKQRDDDQASLKEQMSLWQQLQSDMSAELSELNVTDVDNYEANKNAIIAQYSPLFKAVLENIQYAATGLENSSASLGDYYGTEVIDPLLVSKAVTDALGIKDADIDNWLAALGNDMSNAQGLAQEGVTAATTALTEVTKELYNAIAGNGSDSLAGAQLGQIQALTEMNSAMNNVVTNLGLLDEALKTIKEDISKLSEGLGVKGVSTKYEITIDDKTMTLTPVTLDTGGYTGIWGSEGRLATLHEKELVLNKQDTVNILQAVDIVRSLGDSMLNTVSDMGRGYNLPMAAWELVKEFIVEQTVHINAEFPNATDRSEIEAAFEELMLLATQHAFDSTKD